MAAAEASSLSPYFLISVCGALSFAVLLPRLFGFGLGLARGRKDKLDDTSPGSEALASAQSWGSSMNVEAEIDREGLREGEPVMENTVIGSQSTWTRRSAGQQPPAGPELEPEEDNSDRVLNEILALPHDEVEPPQHNIVASIRRTCRKESFEHAGPESEVSMQHVAQQDSMPQTFDDCFPRQKLTSKSPLHAGPGHDLGAFYQSLEDLEELGQAAEDDCLFADPRSNLNSSLSQGSTMDDGNLVCSVSTKRLGSCGSFRWMGDSGSWNRGDSAGTFGRAKSTQIFDRLGSASRNTCSHIGRSASTPDRPFNKTAGSGPDNLLKKYQSSRVPTEQKFQKRLAIARILTNMRSSYNREIGEYISASEEWW